MQAKPGAPAPTPGAPSGPQFGNLYNQFKQMPTPDPQTFLKTIWDSGILSEMQKEMIMALLQAPEQAPGGAPAGAPGAAAPLGSGGGAPQGKVSPV